MAKVLIMGVVNVTPDSFTDGGSFLDPGAAADHALSLIAQGADIVDLGAESSRPGAAPVTVAEEWRRLEPVLKRLAATRTSITISVDTYKPEIMMRAADCGASVINDIHGAERVPEERLRQLAVRGMSYIAMHMIGDPQTMQTAPLDADASVSVVTRFFAERRERLGAAGFPVEKVWLDPGIGFGKTDAGNLALLRLSMRRANDLNIAVGISRKSFIGRMMGIPSPVERDPASKMLELGLMLSGVRMIRTHDVENLAKLRAMVTDA